MDEPVPHPLLKNIPLLLVVKNRPSDNQISSYDFLKIHKFGIQPGLQITFPKKYPSLLVQFQTPFDNLKKPISLKVHIQLWLFLLGLSRLKWFIFFPSVLDIPLGTSWRATMGQGMAHRIDRLHPWRGMYFFVRELPVFDFFRLCFPL